jgi:hypothetical protein
MPPTAQLPTFTELAGDLEPRLIEGSRIFRARPIHTEAAAKMSLMGATDAAAREAALRWLENKVASAMAMAEMLEGPRADASNTAEWDTSALELLADPLLPLAAYVEASKMARDPDWPDAEQIGRDLCDPSTRGEATRVARDMWWRAMMTEQIEARSKPGQFLASVGIVAEHVADLVAAVPDVLVTTTTTADEGARITTQDVLLTVENQTAEPMDIQGVTLQPGQSVTVPAGGGYVSLPPIADGTTFLVRNDGDEPLSVGAPPAPALQPGQVTVVEPPEVRLPGSRRATQPDAGELRDAFQLLKGAEISAAQADLLKNLGISKSTWNNWLAGRVAPRIDVHQARMLAAECARMISDIERAEMLFKQVTK